MPIYISYPFCWPVQPLYNCTGSGSYRKINSYQHVGVGKGDFANYPGFSSFSFIVFSQNSLLCLVSCYKLIALYTYVVAVMNCPILNVSATQ
jgi:hypothetical protein